MQDFKNDRDEIPYRDNNILFHFKGQWSCSGCCDSEY